MKTFRRFRSTCFALLLLAVDSAGTAGPPQGSNDDQDDSGYQESYGLDVSLPIQRSVSINYAWLPHNDKTKNIPTPHAYQDMPIQPLGDRRAEYLLHLEGCRKNYPVQPEACDHYEYHRMLMNLRQPVSMRNYTTTGFLKTTAPDSVVSLITEFWNRNFYKGVEEKWPVGNSYLNTWISPTYLVSVDDTGLRGSGAELKKQVSVRIMLIGDLQFAERKSHFANCHSSTILQIWSAASATLEAWTGEELQPVSMYGIRVYGEGAIMMPHVDRLPLVASAMICVASDLDEDWPTEVYDHSGKAHNITLQPGEMLLFESHSTIHGHPFPLVGRSYAMIFIHFEPTGHSLRDSSSKEDSQKSLYKRYRDAIKTGTGGQSADAAAGVLPPLLAAC